MKILTVVGARPQFVKAAVVSRAIAQANQSAGGQSVQEIIVHTGQHYDPQMSDVFFVEMRIPRPDVNLHVGSGSHGATTGRMLEGIEKEILERKPDVVLVYGDTNSTLAGALAAAKLHVPVAHVEAGLRSFNMRMPEEINRILTDRVSHWLFCPSQQSVTWLGNEGLTQNVYNVGDVMFDAFLAYADEAKWPAAIERPAGPYALMTLHRAENTDHPERLAGIFAGLSQIDTPILFTAHPRTRKVLEQSGIKMPVNLRIIDPQPYFALLAMLKDCAFVLTDSGGLQKEAYFAGKRGVILRDETEWVELVQTGANRLVGAASNEIAAAAAWARTPLGDTARDVYGQGNTGEIIVRTLLR